MIHEALRRLSLFEDLSEADLEWLSARAEPLRVEAGTNLIEEGDPGEAAFIVVDGEFEVLKKSSRQNVSIAIRAAGEVFGEMALIDQSPRMATVRATRASSVLRISEETFQQLLASSPSASLSILRTVSQRLRQNEALLRQNEKMAALGTLSAGLAHELNNPAAAARRSAEQLGTALADWLSAMTALQALTLNPTQMQTLDALKQRIVHRTAGAVVIDDITRSDREYELQSWLEARGLSDGWKMAPALVAGGWDVASAAELERDFPVDTLGLLLRWVSSGLLVYSLVDEIGLGSERISEIVKAVKAYSFLDQAPVQQVDIKEGLENTLVILRHKLAGIEINREYAPDLPEIEAYGSELNQVWTNMIDNAAYAMGSKGALTVRAFPEDDHVIVEIQDSGPGIPAEIQQRIFEPFFTTKPPGVGTGLGLHIAYTIINNHYGNIQLTSRAGNTCFRIALPVRLPR